MREQVGKKKEFWKNVDLGLGETLMQNGNFLMNSEFKGGEEVVS